MTDSFEKTLPTLLLIFAVVFCLTLLSRFIFALLIFFAKKIYGTAKKTVEPFKKEVKKFIKEDEELLRKLDEIPKAHSATRAGKIGRTPAPSMGSGYELISSEQQQKEQSELNKVSIVDIVKPVGFWTSMILGQKLTYLIQSAQIINKRSDKGFWISMIEAQEQAAGKERGRTR